MDKRSAFLKLVGVLVLVKIGYFVMSVLVGDVSASRARTLHGDAGEAIDIVMKKDAFWYKEIAISGYPVADELPDGSKEMDFSKGQSAWAFFPAYPIVNRWMSQILGCQYEFAALLTSIFYSFLALAGCFLFCLNYWDSTGKAFWTTLLIFIFPFHFYFSMCLTEAPFFSCLIWAFYWVQEKRLKALAVTLIPLVLLRPNGVLMLLPIVLFYLEEREALSLKWKNIKKLRTAIIVCIPAVLSFFGYLWYQYEVTGTAMAFSKAQAGWGKEFMFPFLALFRRGDINYQVTSSYVLAALVFLAAYGRRLPWSMIILVLISLVLPLTAGSTYSMIRYLSVVFPLFLILADITFQMRLRGALVVVLLIGHMASFWLWLADHPLGF